MNVLIACEESQTSCIEFREHGFNAYSCDVEKCSGGHPEWHILEDAKCVLDGGRFKLQNGKWLEVDKWDLIIAHPPCTYLSNAAVQCHSLKTNPVNRINGRTLNRIDGMQFFMRCIMANCEHIAVENPVGIMNTAYRKPDQIIEPYQFAESEGDKENYVTKRTCLWLKNLPLLKTNDLPRPDNAKLFGKQSKGKPFNFAEHHGKINGVKSNSKDEQSRRSKTFPGWAKAFATQWGEYVASELNENITEEIKK